jgi:acyl carrier protein
VSEPLESIRILVAALKSKLARALGVEAKEIKACKGLADYGVDSLTAVELRNWIQRDFGLSVAVFDIVQDGKRIDDIDMLVEEKRENGIT